MNILRKTAESHREFWGRVVLCGCTAVCEVSLFFFLKSDLQIEVVVVSADVAG